MKNQILWRWGLGLALAVMPFAGRCSQEAPNQLTNSPPVINAEGKSNVVAQATAEPSTASADQGSEADLASAAFQPISTGKPLPPNIKPTAPVAEVIRLAEAGVEEAVMLAFITNSTSTFNLGAGEIIYLNDIGVPGAVVTAMIQRDQTLKGFPANKATAVATTPAPDATASQFAPAPYPTPEPTTPAPEETAPGATPQPEYASADYTLPPPEESTYSNFYDSLAPYGTWVNVAGCGPCWQPTVVVGNPNWQPYFNGGRWVYTDCGWYWLSDYSWGWAAFHYGRWFRHSRLGWCWAPDNVWGPSWVCWRYTSAYCGWAPLPPGASYRPGAGLTYRGRPAGSTFGFGLGARSFAFVEFGHLWDHRLPPHALPSQQTARIFNQTVASASIAGSNNRVINNGMSPSRVVAATHTGIHRVTIQDAKVATARKSDPAPRFAAPLILHGPDRPGQAVGANGGSAVKEVIPRNALVMTGKKEVTRAPAFNQASAPVAQTPQFQTTAPAQNSFPRPEMNQRPQARSSYSSEFQRPSYTSWSAPAPVDRQYTAPSYQAAEVPRSAPAPTYTPQHTYSAPAVSYTPRAEPMESRPAYSAPSAPAASAPAAYSHSSSDRNGR